MSSNITPKTMPHLDAEAAQASDEAAGAARVEGIHARNPEGVNDEEAAAEVEILRESLKEYEEIVERLTAEVAEKDADCQADLAEMKAEVYTPDISSCLYTWTAIKLKKFTKTFAI